MVTREALEKRWEAEERREERENKTWEDRQKGRLIFAGFAVFCSLVALVLGILGLLSI